jgi:hypothetical protein
VSSITVTMLLIKAVPYRGGDQSCSPFCLVPRRGPHIVFALFLKALWGGRDDQDQ